MTDHENYCNRKIYIDDLTVYIFETKMALTTYKTGAGMYRVDKDGFRSPFIGIEIWLKFLEQNPVNYKDKKTKVVYFGEYKDCQLIIPGLNITNPESCVVIEQNLSGPELLQLPKPPIKRGNKFTRSKKPRK